MPSYSTLHVEYETLELNDLAVLYARSLVARILEAVVMATLHSDKERCCIVPEMVSDYTRGLGV